MYYLFIYWLIDGVSVWLTIRIEEEEEEEMCNSPHFFRNNWQRVTNFSES